MKSHFISYDRIFGSLHTYSSEFKGAQFVTELLAFPVTLILQDTFAQGAQRPLQLLKTLQSQVIPIQFYPPKFTGHYNQITLLVPDEFLTRLCSAKEQKPVLSSCLFLLTEVSVCARAACADQLLCSSANSLSESFP